MASMSEVIGAESTVAVAFDDRPAAQEMLAASALVAFALSARLQRFISGPILDLAAATRTVSQERNYSIHVPKQGGDEIGQLIDGFNAMLTQIKMRDFALQNAHDDLEQRVQERTRDLAQEVAERMRAGERIREEANLLDLATD